MSAPVVVVGAGISGLAAAWELARTRDVLVLEASDRVGGKLRSDQVGGVSVDVGAEAVLARRPEAVGLIAELGLAAVAPTTTSARLRVGGALHPMPARTMFGIPSDPDVLGEVLTSHAVRRVAAEPDLPPLPPLSGDVAVGALVRERLGNEVADRLVEPLLGGVYAGRADLLSLRATMPMVAGALREGGSLVAAAQRLVTAAPPSTGPVFASVAGGLGTIPQALAASGRFEVRTGVTVRSIRTNGNGFLLDCGAVPASYTVAASGVIVASPAPKAARLVADLAPDAAPELAAIDTASMAIVTFAFRDVDLPEGSGLLVGAREGLAVKGVTVTSQKWPIETGGLVLLRASVGRVGDTAVLQRSDEQLIALVRHELELLLGIGAAPVDVRVTRWGGGLPQYGVGHLDRIARIRTAIAAVPGLAICGAAFDGVGVPACIAAARAAVAGLEQ